MIPEAVVTRERDRGKRGKMGIENCFLCGAGTTHPAQIRLDHYLIFLRYCNKTVDFAKAA
jgi:hypothetical protein